MFQHTGLIGELVQSAQNLTAILNHLSTHANLDNALKRQVIVAWVNAYAQLPSTGALTQEQHAFYADLFTAMLTPTGDSALAYILNDTHHFSQPQFSALVSLVCRHAAGNNYQTSQRYTRLNGRVYTSLHTHYLTVDSELLLGVLISDSATDRQLQGLMSSQHLEKYAQALVSKTQDFNWLIDHEKTSSTMMYHMTRDKRFTTAHALRMLNRALPPAVMDSILENTQICTNAVHLAFLNNATRQNYHDRCMDVLFAKLSTLSAEELLTLIQHPSCKTNDQFERVIPHCNTPAVQQSHPQ